MSYNAFYHYNLSTGANDFWLNATADQFPIWLPDGKRVEFGEKVFFELVPTIVKRHDASRVAMENMPREMAQAIFDALWQEGLRPGKHAAQMVSPSQEFQEHIKDLRLITMELLAKMPNAKVAIAK